MGQSLFVVERSTAVTMKILLLLALAAHQINGQEDGSGNGGMDGSGMEGSGSGMGGSGYGMGGSGYGGYGMGGSGYGDWMGGSGYGGDWMNGGGECCRTKKIWDHWDQDKNGIYDLVMDGDMMNGMGSGYGGYGMGSGYGGYGMGYGYGMGSGSGEDMGSGYGMGSGMGSGDGYGMNMGYGGMGMGGGYGGMGMDMGSMDWPRRCRSRCAYKKRDSYDDRMYCFARSEYSQSMCMRDDYDDENGEWEGYGSGYGSGMGFGSGMENMDPSARYHGK